MNKIIVISAITLLVLLMGSVFYLNKSSVAVSQTYTLNGEVAKIVYEINKTSSLESCEKDCNERGGSFEECGNPCDPEADVCEAVCAVTCTLI